MIWRAALVVVSLLFSLAVGLGLKAPSGIFFINHPSKRKRPGFPDLSPIASMASAITSVVKDQKRYSLRRL
jgi:hypothetical protein